jgi:hypothetical protein
LQADNSVSGLKQVVEHTHHGLHRHKQWRLPCHMSVGHLTFNVRGQKSDVRPTWVDAAEERRPGVVEAWIVADFVRDQAEPGHQRSITGGAAPMLCFVQRAGQVQRFAFRVGQLEIGGLSGPIVMTAALQELACLVACHF